MSLYDQAKEYESFETQISDALEDPVKKFWDDF